MEKSDKKYSTAVILSAIFGIFGIHHFYLGRWLHGLLDISMTLGAFILISLEHILFGSLLLGIDIIHTFIVTIILLVGAYRDGKGCLVTYPNQIIK